MSQEAQQNRQVASKGRMVRLFLHDADGALTEECAAIIAHVFEGNPSECVNLCGIRENGNASAFTSVPRLLPENAARANGAYWEFPQF